jgi:hypothetical protein
MSPVPERAAREPAAPQRERMRATPVRRLVAGLLAR